MSNHTPTIQMRITNLGLEFISEFITKILNQQCNFMIPFMDLSDPSLQINITNATISEFISPNLKLKPKSPHGIVIEATNGSLKSHSFFTTFLPLIFKTVTVTGEADVNASNFIVKLEMDVLTRNLHPLIKLRKCAMNIRNISVVYHSNSNLLNILSTMKNLMSQIIVRKISTEFCKRMNQTMIANVNDMILRIPQYSKLLGNLYTNYEFQEDMIAEENYLQANAFWQILAFQPSLYINKSLIKINTTIQSSSNAFYNISENKHMFHIWLSDNIANKLFNTLFENEYLILSIDHNFHSGIFAKFLRTNCLFYELCIGHLFPIFATKFPNQTATIRLHAIKPPVYSTTPNGITVNAVLLFELFIPNFENEIDGFAQFTTMTSYTILPSFHDQILLFQIVDANVSIIEFTANIGQLPTLLFNMLMKTIKVINSWIGTIVPKIGITLPIIGGYAIEQSTSIDLLNDTMLINLNFVKKSNQTFSFIEIIYSDLYPTFIY
ncbi:Uncharacterized protein BM_BM795 [Brugia malayi]|uniref:BPI2 domain-containing protein n=1 Tax=Brugia malayi TaxID=6279 RepID=A0A4E9F1Q4_BRUMA|nr:Uncharacterized protein BM_BM795 [Brugia malayi]VIO90121.1 Uncharacterized protein BM_BM795 [Brugia malayi]